MGFFNRVKTVFAAYQKNWGGAFYHHFRPHVNKYFEDGRAYPGAESEAILLHAAMMKIIFIQKFDAQGPKGWEEYVMTMLDDLRGRIEFRHRLDGKFITERIDFYERRWVDLLTNKELLLFDVCYLLYYSPLAEIPDKYGSAIDNLGNKPPILHHTMAKIYTEISNAIDRSIKENSR